MKNLGIAALILGVCLEALAIFGNRMPYPIVLKIVCPEYVSALEGYDKLLLDGVLEPGDPGFDSLCVAYLHLMLSLPEVPFPRDELDGLTVARFRAGPTKESGGTMEKTIVVAEFSNGQNIPLDYGVVRGIANTYWTVNALLINCGLLILGCTMVFYGLKITFLDSRSVENEADTRADALPVSHVVSDGG